MASSSSASVSQDAMSNKVDVQAHGGSNKRLAALVVLIIPVVGLAVLLWWVIRRCRRRQRLRRLRLNNGSDNNNTDEALTQDMLGMDDSPWLRSTDPSRATAVSALGANKVAEEANTAGGKGEFDPLYAQAEAQRLRRARRRQRHAAMAKAQDDSNNAQDKNNSTPQDQARSTLAASGNAKESTTNLYSPMQLVEDEQRPTTVFASSLRQPTLYAHEETGGSASVERQNTTLMAAGRASSSPLNSIVGPQTGSPYKPPAAPSISSSSHYYDPQSYNATTKVLMEKYTDAGKQNASTTDGAAHTINLEGITHDEHYTPVAASNRRQESGVFESILSAAAAGDNKLPVADTIATTSAGKDMQKNTEIDNVTTTATRHESGDDEEGEYVEETTEASDVTEA